tara:strand:- start:64 stop:306 length:243 start_codon:yes stop_codon:yes gene_type:complete
MGYITYEVRVYEGGTKYWLLCGQRHREDGPTIEYPDGRKEWWLNGVEYSEEDFNEKMAPTTEMTVAEVGKALGRKVKIIG